MPTDWAQTVREYVLAQQAVGRPKTTIGTRKSHIARIARSLHCPPEQVTGDQLVQWFGTQTQWALETRRGYYNTARSFFGWCHDTGRIPTNPAAALAKVSPASPSPRPAPDRVMIESTLAADPRTTVMLRLASELGMRRAEVAQVRTDDLIESFDGWQLLVRGKGNKVRMLPVSDELARTIAAGAQGHTPSCPVSNGWLFPGDDGGHLSPRWVGTLCSRVMPGVWTMHTLRHRFATRAYRGTNNIRAVQTLLGHDSVATTQRYTAVDDSEVRAAMMAAAPTPVPRNTTPRLIAS